MSYVYLLYHRSTKMYYVGVRYAKNATPDDFWKTYFTSSKIVHKLIQTYGINDFRHKIVKTYTKVEDAILAEHQWTLRAIRKRHYLNAGAGIAVRPDICSLAGKIGGSIQHKTKRGFHKLTPEEHKIASSRGGKRGAFTQSKWQAEFGRRGGVKNKNKHYITDGHTERKINDGDAIPDGWSLGRNPSRCYKRRWVNDGVRNYFVKPEEVHLYNLGKLPEDTSKYARKDTNAKNRRNS